MTYEVDTLDMERVVAGLSALADGLPVRPRSWDELAADYDAIRSTMVRLIVLPAFNEIERECLHLYGHEVLYEGTIEALDEAKVLLAPLTARVREPGDWLGGVHQLLTATRLTEDEGRLTIQSDITGRKSGGVYYTPDCLVDALLDQCLTPLIDEAFGPTRHREGCLCPTCLEAPT